jgi:hypothetical protein
MRRFALALALAVLAPLSAHAQSVVGKWDVQMNTPIGPRPFTVELKADGDSLSGGVKNENGEYAVRGAVKEQTVTFWYTIEYGGAAQDVFEAKRAAATPPAAPPAKH